MAFLTFFKDFGFFSVIRGFFSPLIGKLLKSELKRGATMTDRKLLKLTSDLTDAVNDAYRDGITPNDVFNALASTIATSARVLGAGDEDIFHLFASFGYGFRPSPDMIVPPPRAEVPLEAHV